MFRKPGHGCLLTIMCNMLAQAIFTLRPIWQSAEIAGRYLVKRSDYHHIATMQFYVYEEVLS
jgi:hypothetical protein